ncbi:type I restriction enzyme HsdR N-terminal domain-containing protein [Desulfovibrio gilichinskyi]|uniref:Type I restriction enzyme R protein N terminus (HSDR_N) n=1 Tax=Desulfovibrio gilichinskyi TaxID=1519643 RepID=A0A1X7ESG9_9BACT|nr:type I restriction enzyme HsdR N-terminal domain-containing protein [Desulfovibrio gilichinskyi]SMF39302.1 Type I restriction enzyme R protein N terminus (HSDR_N) [Desulfovibrio gilichinskyi]
MHEISMGGTLRDYLSGEEIDETTYEEFRQALAKILVEEHGYPKDSLKAKVDLCFNIDGEEMCRTIDLVVYDPEGLPILMVMFCAGDVGSYEREAVCAGKLFQGGPVPYVVITDSMDAFLLDAISGDTLAHGMRSVPDYKKLLAMVEGYKREPLPAERRTKIERIFYTYTGFLQGTCCSETCSLPPVRKIELNKIPKGKTLKKHNI